ncbi:aspartate kinase [Lutispora thermophila]|uniref:Aspartokinase n=1 Tax=Lutispora thermophila DSM 19022 TaxID=1122184 RepID=A0A1M6I5R1_9FIRM|nr:aspartate kinase [Lutispora thermophila]SHJ29765.1 aspartate kinase [Lutispora thermophila DSM 19022]
MRFIVQKFGGTSVSTQERRNMVVNKIETAKGKDYFPVVVVSAIGRNGDPYATDTLINLAKSVGVEPNLRELDLLMSCGEIISCVVLANTLKKRGHECKVFTGGQAGIITDDNYGDAEVIRVEPKNILECVEKNIIPIIAGFQGVTEDGNITTLGRGGSDVSAAIIGEAINAEVVEIYTDVDGVMTADPAIVRDAKVMETVFYNEIFQMAEYGAKVIHPRAVEIAMRSNIPLMIKSTLSEKNGTLITNYDKSRRYRHDKEDKLITAIAQIGNRSQFKVIFDGSADQYEKDTILFNLIAAERISIDMINIYPDIKVFIVDGTNESKLKNILKSQGYNFEVISNCTKVTIIGNKMRGMPGVMAKMIEALSDNNIEILQTSDSHTTISCLIKSENTNVAVNALHKKFELGTNK